MIKRIFLVLSAIVIVACSSSDNGGGKTKGDDFDRGTMLVNWANNIIIPVFQDLNTKLEALVDVKNTFIANPNQTNLNALRASWLQAYSTWQYAEMFNIGKAEAINYAFQMNIYPTSVTDIEANIDNGTYDLAHVNNNDAVGFPALDYLLYGVANNDAALLDVYTTNANASGYKTYVSDLVNRMKTLTESVLDDWTSSYKDEFVNSTANTATSATNMLVNDFIYYYEKGLRANKVGIPAGVYSTNPLPEKVEGYYNGQISKQLALEGLKAAQDFFNGKAYGGTAVGNSLDDYLDYLNTLTGGDNIASLINSQLNVARTKLNDLDASFTNQINTDNQKMTVAFDELQKVVVFLKTDMVQAMNISVDYVDADGD